MFAWGIDSPKRAMQKVRKNYFRTEKSKSNTGGTSMGPMSSFVKAVC